VAQPRSGCAGCRLPVSRRRAPGLRETIALADTSEHAPITYYIRCSHAVEKPATFIAALVMSFILGHWLCRRDAE
jgi:hypothetical protein